MPATDLTQSVLLCLYWLSQIDVAWWQFVGMYAAAYICWLGATTRRFTPSWPLMRALRGLVAMSICAALVSKLSGDSLVAAVVCVTLGAVCHQLAIPDAVHTWTWAVCMVLLVGTSAVAPSPSDTEQAQHTLSAWAAWAWAAIASLHMTAPGHPATHRGYGAAMVTFMLAMRVRVAFMRTDRYRYAGMVALPLSVLTMCDAVGDIATGLLGDHMQRQRSHRVLMWYMGGWALTIGYVASRFDMCLGIIQAIHLIFIGVHTLAMDSAAAAIKTTAGAYRR